MTSYKVISTDLVTHLTVGSSIVVEAGPALHWSVGRDFEAVRDYCRKRGWQIEPVVEDVRPRVLEMDGTVYELMWNGCVITRIYRYKEGKAQEMRYDELPDPIKSLL